MIDLLELGKKTPGFIMLCGVPGVGKTTWIDNFLDENFFDGNRNDWYIISTDNIIEIIADGHNFTYNEVFGDITYSFGERLMHKLAKMHFTRGDNVIWDQTNLNIKTRAKKLALVPSHYHKTAVVFNIPHDHADRLQKRANMEKKFIPVDVLDKMIGRFERPTVAEGFDKILEVTVQ